MEIRIFRTWYDSDCEPTGRKEEETHDESRIREVADNEGNWNEDDSEWIMATIPEAVVKLLNDEYVTETSDLPWGVGAWYLGSSTSNPYTEETVEVTMHLEGFTEAQEREIYALWSKKDPR